MIRLDLPLPPSTNSAYFNVPGKGRVPSAKHSEWKREAGWLVRLANPSPIIGPYRFVIKAPASAVRRYRQPREIIDGPAR